MASNGFVGSLFDGRLGVGQLGRLGVGQLSIFGVSASNVIILVGRMGFDDSIVDDAGWIVDVSWINDKGWRDGASEGSRC